MPPLLNGDKEKTLVCGSWNGYLHLLWITMSRAFVCLPTLESTPFEQQVCSTKIGYTNALLLGTNIRKKRNVDTFDSAHQAKKAVQLWQWLVWTTTERCTLLLLKFLNLRDLFAVWIKLKENIFKNSN